MKHDLIADVVMKPFESLKNFLVNNIRFFTYEL